MSERKPRDLRFLRKKSLEHERKMYENYFHDLIYNYGVDTTYFRHDTKFPERFDLTPALTGLEDLIYGENANMEFYLSGDMIVYIEVENDIFELNKWALLPNENINIYFTVGDFNTKFAPQLGSKKVFSDSIEFSGLISTSGTFEVSADFNASGLSGSISTVISANPGSYSVSSFTVYVNTTSGYLIPVNEYIASPKYYKVSGGDYMAASYGSINVGTSSYEGSALVGVLYYEPISPNKYNTNIMPKVGDFFRMTFFDNNYEEYEITNIADRVLTTDGINPLLGKYIWKCSAIRRNPSHEDVIGDNKMENKSMHEIQNLESYAVETLADTIYSYTGSADDEVYGGYNDTGSYLISSEVNLGDYVVSGIIFTFDYGPSTLFTDGKNLYFNNENGHTTLLSDNSSVATVIPDLVVGLKYLRSDNENLYFVNNLEQSWKLTDSFGSVEYLESIMDISTVIPQSDSFSTSGMYCVLDAGFVLFSDGINLFAINGDLETTKITNN